MLEVRSEKEKVKTRSLKTEGCGTRVLPAHKGCSTRPALNKPRTGPALFSGEIFFSYDAGA